MTVIERSLGPFPKLVNRSSPQSLLLVEAPEGYGKTTLLRQMVEWCDLNRTPRVYIDFDQSNAAQKLKLERLLLEIGESCFQFPIELSEELSEIIDELQNIIKPKIRETIKDTFNLEELKSLCFDLRIDYEDLARANRTGKIEELINYVERHEKKEEFFGALKLIRPNIDWSNWIWKAYTLKLSQIIKFEDIAKYIHQSIDIYSVETTLNRATRLLKKGLRLCKQKYTVLLIDSCSPSNPFPEVWDWLEKEFIVDVAKSQLPMITVISGRDLSHVKIRCNGNPLKIDIPPLNIVEIKKIANQRGVYPDENELRRILSVTKGIPKKVVLNLELYKSQKNRHSVPTFSEKKQDYSQQLLGVMPLVQEILLFQPKKMKEAFISSSIPHQFDSTLLAMLLDLDVTQSDRLTKRISESPLIRKNHRFYSYDAEVRNYLIRVAETNELLFKNLNLRAAYWFLNRLAIDNINIIDAINVNADESSIDQYFDAIQSVLEHGDHLEFPEAVGDLTEALYHLLIIDSHHAFSLLKDMYNDLEAHGRPSSCRHLLIVLTEQKRYLTAEQIYQLDYFQCRLCIKLGEWKLAEKGLLELSQNSISDSLRLSVSEDLIFLLLEMGKGKEALLECEKIEHAVEAAKSTSSSKEFIVQLNSSMAKALKLCGRLDDAVDRYEVALQVAQETRDSSLIAGSCLRKGLIHKDLGEWSRALEYCSKALRIYQNINHARGMIHTIITIGNIYQTQGNWKLARKNYHKALHRFSKLEEKEDTLTAKAVILANFAEIYIKQGDWAKGEQALHDFQVIAEELDNQQLLGTAYLMRGKFYKEQGDWQYAVDYYNRARNIHDEKTGNPVELGNALAELSEIYRLRGMWTFTVKYLEQALENWGRLI
jgi:tetratricopeptide (TPR) repeat protein